MSYAITGSTLPYLGGASQGRYGASGSGKWGNVMGETVMKIIVTVGGIATLLSSLSDGEDRRGSRRTIALFAGTLGLAFGYMIAHEIG